MHCSSFALLAFGTVRIPRRRGFCVDFVNVFKRAQRHRRSLATGTDRISLAKRVAEQMGCHYMHALTEMGERRTNPYKKAADKIKTELTEKLFGEGSLVDPDK